MAKVEIKRGQVPKTVPPHVTGSAHVTINKAHVTKDPLHEREYLEKGIPGRRKQGIEIKVQEKEDLGQEKRDPGQKKEYLGQEKEDLGREKEDLGQEKEDQN